MFSKTCITEQTLAKNYAQLRFLPIDFSNPVFLFFILLKAISAAESVHYLKVDFE